MLVLVAACNIPRVTFEGLGDPDATGPDGADARTTGCPAIGQPPSYGSAQHPVIGQMCESYTISASAGFAVAMCGGKLDQGPIDGTLVDTGTAPTGTFVAFGSIALFPEGTAAIVEQFDEGFSTVAASIFTHELGTTTWTYANDLPFSASSSYLGNASAGPDRRMLQAETNGTFHEWRSDSAGLAWTEITSHEVPLYAFVVNYGPRMTADGLRIVFRAARTGLPDGLLYADRPTLDDNFSIPVPLQIADETSPFLLDDCSRIYFTSFNAIAYLQEG